MTNQTPRNRPSHRERTPLRTSVVGSYSVPEWLGHYNTDFRRGRISAELLDEIHGTAIKAALVDQTHAGVDVVSDGEFRRDNDMDYFIERIPGVTVVGGPKSYYYDYLEAVVDHPIPKRDAAPPLGLVDDYRFTAGLTDKAVTISIAGPFSLSHRLRNEQYKTPDELVLALSEVLGAEARRLAEAGATHIQIDEPFLAGYPERIDLAVKAWNVLAEGVDAHLALHICYGNRYARAAWEGHYDFLFPAVLEAQVDELVLEFGRKGLDDLELFRRFPNDFEVGAGVVDVKSNDVEPALLIAQRLYQAIRIVPPERLVVNPDCGLRHLAPQVARAKLAAMVEGAAIVRADVLGENPPTHEEIAEAAEADGDGSGGNPAGAPPQSA